ncbi:hypothetical protein R5R35_014508 [Gryllus longicercus]|uniref:Peptidase S1 domain-containing protein n=1 Tax=Gryllus longicercus TaxID=2509291 RepID=A0AAN9Z2K7_9ORTH
MGALARCLVLCALASASAAGSDRHVSLGIFDGTDAAEHEFPSQVFVVSLINEPWRGNSFYRTCGGTIISAKWILTAAHCVNGSARTEVRAGSSARGPAWRPGKLLAKRRIVHEKYRLYGRNDNNAADDIALVELELPLDGRRMAAVPIAKGKPARRRGVVIGWGLTEQGDFAKILQKLDVNIIPCPEKTPKAICIRSAPGSGVCSGDSGGPLLVDGVLHGVASYIDLADKTLEPNDHCGDGRAWGVYMRVASYRRWIQRHTGIAP